MSRDDADALIDIRTSIQLLSDRLDEFAKRLLAHDHPAKPLPKHEHSEMHDLRAELTELREHVVELTHRVTELSRVARTPA